MFHVKHCEENKTKALKLTYEGRVQGVGFRKTATSIASRHMVTGYVMNLDDGRVEALIQGSADEVDACTSAIDSRMKNNIKNKQSINIGHHKHYEGFSIQY